MRIPTLPVIERATGRIMVVDFETYDTTHHQPLIPEVTMAPTQPQTPTKQDTDRAIAKEIYGRHQF